MMTKKHFELTYDELYSLDKEGIRQAYREENLSEETIEWTYKFFQGLNKKLVDK